MQELAVRYYAKGLQIVCFPCNQFLGQEPWAEPDIKRFITKKWPNLNATLFSKIDVNGDNTHKVYDFLKECFAGDINWNFATKFIIGPDGIPVQRYDKKQTWEEIETCIQEQLEKVVQIPDKIENEQNIDNIAEEKKNDSVAFDAEKYVTESINAGPVVVIAKSYCQYCKAAMTILDKYCDNIIKKDIDLEFNEADMTEVQKYCETLTGESSVPRVFINQKCIGGSDAIKALDDKGELEKLLNKSVQKTE